MASHKISTWHNILQSQSLQQGEFKRSRDGEGEEKDLWAIYCVFVICSSYKHELTMFLTILISKYKTVNIGIKTSGNTVIEGVLKRY